MPVAVKIKFDTAANRRFLVHDGAFVPLDASGNGTMQVEVNEFDLILFGIEGAPGTTGTITITPPANHKLEISSHPIQIRVAQGKTRAGDNRFFRVKPN